MKQEELESLKQMQGSMVEWRIDIGQMIIGYIKEHGGKQYTALCNVAGALDTAIGNIDRIIKFEGG